MGLRAGYAMRMQQLIPLTEVHEGELTHCELNGERVLIGIAREKPFAIKDVCPHAYVSFGHGMLSDCTITCPWHGLSFDVHTGECDYWPDLERLTRFEVAVRDGNVWVGDPIED